MSVCSEAGGGACGKSGRNLIVLAGRRVRGARKRGRVCACESKRFVTLVLEARRRWRNVGGKSRGVSEQHDASGSGLSKSQRKSDLNRAYTG